MSARSWSISPERHGGPNHRFGVLGAGRRDIVFRGAAVAIGGCSTVERWKPDGPIESS
jgi:hypothetical protein